jgi:hypothetical protein
VPQDKKRQIKMLYDISRHYGIIIEASEIIIPQVFIISKKSYKKAGKRRCLIMPEKDNRITVKDEITRAVQEVSQEGRVTCAELQALAEKLGCSYEEIGQVANSLNIKIKQCQLGCF